MREIFGASLALALASQVGWAQGAAQGAAGQLQVNECVLAPAQGVSDLVSCSVGFNGLGEITYALKNRGTVGVNTAGPISSSATQSKTRTATEPGPRIKVDLYLDDRLIQSVYHPSISGGETKHVATKIPSNFPTPRCGETRKLRVVVDPQNQIVEASESNNARDRTTDRPCPDFDVVSIRANYNKLRTEFVAEIKVVNKGNADGRFRYLALTSNSSSYGPLPSADFDKLMELAAGQTKTFTIGNTFAYNRMYVRVFLDRFREVDELDEGNNFKEKTIPD